jgi:hypothetical protein
LRVPLKCPDGASASQPVVSQTETLSKYLLPLQHTQKTNSPKMAVEFV